MTEKRGRIAERFDELRSEGRTGLITFVTAGFPDVASTAGIVRSLVEGGSDLIELGIPFSDPLAEGPVIQHSSQRALDGGVTMATCLDIVREIRHNDRKTPVVAMGYYNPLLAYGLSEFARDAAAAGVDGVIVVDLPPEESGEFRSICSESALDLIPLVAPTSTDERLALACNGASGFVYCVSVRGVTNVRDELPPDLAEFLGRVRRQTDLPLAVGFGVSRREHVEAVGRLADAAIIGSAIVRILTDAPAEERNERIRTYVEVVTGRQRADVGRRAGGE